MEIKFNIPINVDDKVYRIHDNEIQQGSVYKIKITSTSYKNEGDPIVPFDKDIKVDIFVRWSLYDTQVYSNIDVDDLFYTDKKKLIKSLVDSL